MIVSLENPRILINILTILDINRNKQFPSLEINAKTPKISNRKADLMELLLLALGLKFPLGHVRQYTECLSMQS
jgi:hypothetical protein